MTRVHFVLMVLGIGILGMALDMLAARDVVVTTGQTAIALFAHWLLQPREASDPKRRRVASRS
jgi:hypothetical protein